MRIEDGAQSRASNFTYLAHGGVSLLELGNSRWENARYNSRLQFMRVGMGTTSTDTSLLKIDYNYGTTNTNGFAPANFRHATTPSTEAVAIPPWGVRK